MGNIGVPAGCRAKRRAALQGSRSAQPGRGCAAERKLQAHGGHAQDGMAGHAWHGPQTAKQRGPTFQSSSPSSIMAYTPGGGDRGVQVQEGAARQQLSNTLYSQRLGAGDGGRRGAASQECTAQLPCALHRTQRRPPAAAAAWHPHSSGSSKAATAAALALDGSTSSSGDTRQAAPGASLSPRGLTWYTPPMSQVWLPISTTSTGSLSPCSGAGRGRQIAVRRDGTKAGGHE